MVVIIRQSVRNINRLFVITGIILPTFVKNRSSLFLGYIRTCLSLLVIGVAQSLVLIYTYRHRSKFIEFGLGLPYLGYGFIQLTAIFTIIYMRNELDHLLRRIDQNIFTYSQEKQIKPEYSWLYRESSTRTVYLLVFLYNYLSVLPCCLSLIDHFILKRTSLTLPFWMPWDQEEHFFATYLTQILLAFGVTWSVSIIQLFIVFGVIEFSRQNIRLCSALSSVEQRSEQTALAKIKDDERSTHSLSKQDKKDLFDNEFQINLKQCIQHHQKVVELFQTFKSWFSILFFIELLTDSLTFAVIFYNLFQASSWVVYSGIIASSYIFITSLFTKCLVGEHFSDMNEKIATIIFYEVRWYEQSLSNRRLLSIFHSQVRRPMDLYAFSIFKASFFTFASLTKTSYSYLNILKATFSLKK